MIEYITPDTIANTARMGAQANRPKTVFLAESQSDIDLAHTYVTQKNCRIIPAHTREKAMQAFQILAESGFAGVLTAVSISFESKENKSAREMGFGFQGKWEDIVARGSSLAGSTVLVIGVKEPTESQAHSPNLGMLAALASIRKLGAEMSPKKDKADYLKLGREGEMYGLPGAE